jgi:hypothetical protein
MNTKEVMVCPVCKKEMDMGLGTAVHPGDSKYGVVVYCPHLDCPAQEVSGHGKDEKDAYRIVKEKFVKRDDR